MKSGLRSVKRSSTDQEDMYGKQDEPNWKRIKAKKKKFEKEAAGEKEETKKLQITLRKNSEVFVC